MLKIVICEDDPVQLAFLGNSVKDLFCENSVNVILYSSCSEFLDVLETGCRLFDIAIIDIELGASINGIEIAKFMNEKSPHTQIIFVSAHLQYAPELYSTEHVYFIMKPVKPSILKASLTKAVNRYERLMKSVLFLHSRGATIAVPYGDILYCESRKRVVRIHCRDSTVESYVKLDELEHSTQEGPFVRCHKSFLVNMAMIRRLDASHIVMINSDVLPVSAQRYRSARKKFLQFIGEL
jgi:DNA-binding LytR/AlgR family response regulator